MNTTLTRSFSLHIPNLEGNATAEIVPMEVQVYVDPETGEEILTADSIELIEKTKARFLGLLTIDQLKALRDRLSLTQKQISELLQIGEKTWTRWESGRERPSRSINVLLSALNEGKIDVAYLRSLARRRNDWASWNAAPRAAKNTSLVIKPELASIQEAPQGQARE